MAMGVFWVEDVGGMVEGKRGLGSRLALSSRWAVFATGGMERFYEVWAMRNSLS